MIDAVVVQKWLKAKSYAEAGGMLLVNYEECFILVENPSMKPIIISEKLDDILKELEKMNDDTGNGNIPIKTDNSGSHNGSPAGSGITDCENASNGPDNTNILGGIE